MLPFPIRSEADAFRWVVIVGLAGLSIGIVTAIAGRTAGALWGLLLLVAAFWAGFRAWRAARGAERRRVLLLAEGRLDPQLVAEAMGERWSAEPHEVLIVVPSQAQGDPIAIQRELQDMEISLQAVKEAGARAEARVVDEEPGAAVAAAHAEFEPHEVLIALRTDHSAWGDLDVEKALGASAPVSRHPLVPS